MKQAILSMVVVLVAAGILTGMVLYSVSLMRFAQLQLLTGEPVEKLRDEFWIQTIAE